MTDGTIAEQGARTQATRLPPGVNTGVQGWNGAVYSIDSAFRWLVNYLAMVGSMPEAFGRLGL